MFTVLMMSCHNDDEVAFDYYSLVPEGFPLPEMDSIPTVESIDLGRKLFFDPILSKDSTISCASCHSQSLAFSDTMAKSLGVFQRVGTRNAISLANVVYQKKLLREGGLPTLEMQVLVPIQEHAEMDNSMLLIADRLNGIPEYVSMSMDAYHRKLDPFVITRAIAAFERTIFSGKSKYDAFKNNKATLTPQEQKGMELFMSDKTKCAQCHGGFLFTNQQIENNGLYENYEDIGLMRLTGKTEDNGKFKIPSLRNVAITAPYMHDGSMKTLDAVIDHYNRGGMQHANKHPLIQPLSLSETEKAALKSFLLTLTDQKLLEDPFYRKR